MSRTVLLGTICGLLLVTASLPSTQARPEKAGWPEDSPFELKGSTSFSTRGLSSLQSAAPRLRVLLEDASPEDSMQNFPATQDENTSSALPEESIATPNNAAHESTTSDLELFYSVGRLLGKYAIQNRIGLVISIGPQPARYLTTPTPELFNLLNVALLSYGQKHHMGGCSMDQSCQATIDPPSNAAQESISSDVELLNSVGRALGKYALQNNIGLDIVVGAQPTRDLTTPTPELFNSLGVVVGSYAQKQHMGGCSEDQPCKVTLIPSVLNKIQVWIESMLRDNFWVTVLCFGILIILVCVASSCW